MAGLGAGGGEIPAASAGMTELRGGGWDGEPLRAGAALGARGWGGGLAARKGLGCWARRDTRGKRGYDESILRGYDGALLRGVAELFARV